MQASNDQRTEEFEPENFLASLFGVTKSVLLSPRPFYEGMKTQGGFRNPFIFLACCIVVHSLLAGLVLNDQTLIVRNLMMGLAMPFVTAGLLFFFLTRFFKASGTYEAAFRVNAYAGAINLLSWIPSMGVAWGLQLIGVIGLVLEFYRVYLIVVGLTCTFSAKTSRAVLAVVLTLVVYVTAAGALSFMTGGQWPKAGP